MLSQRLDKVAIFLSSVCVIHCLIAPVLITFIPIFGLNAFTEDAVFHQLMLWVVLPTSTVALLIGCMRHRNTLIICSGVLGILLLIIMALYGHQLFGERGEKILSIIAGVVLAYSHFLNYRACQRRVCKDKDCQSKHHH